VHSLEKPARTDFIVDHRKIMVGLIMLITGILALCVPRMSVDVTLKAGLNTSTVEYKRYQDFLGTFGTEDYVLVVIKSEDPGTGGSKLLDATHRIAKALESTPHIVDVASLTNLKLFGQKQGVFGSYAVLESGPDGLSFPGSDALEKVRKALPIVDLLVSTDLATTGIIIGVDQEISFDVPVIEKLLDDIEAVVRTNVPKGSEYRIIGGPVIRRAIQHYNLQTAVMFGVLCSLICTIVAYYIFKSLRVTLITGMVVGLCVFWIVGIMAALNIQLNSTTALSFGLVLISSVEPVIHLVTHYNQYLREGNDPVAAAKMALRTGAGPCLVTSLTTSLGFSSLIVASFPMVQQLGMILALGPLTAFVLAVVLTPALLISMKPPPPPVFKAMATDLVSRAYQGILGFVFAHSRLCAYSILILIMLMLAGAPFIRSDPQLLRMLTDSTKEIKDLRFVENNLTPVSSVELVVVGKENDFKRSDMWQRVKEMRERVREVHDVSSVDSFLPLLEYLHAVASKSGVSPDDLFLNPTTIPQLIALTSLSPDGQKMLRRFLDEKFSIL